MSDADAFDMSAARKLWAKKELEPKKAARKNKRHDLAGGVDKRSLRATGRVEQFNIRCRPEIKALAFEHQQRMGMETVAEFIECAILAFVREGKGE